jgi:hypothetical protein
LLASPVILLLTPVSFALLLLLALSSFMFALPFFPFPFFPNYSIFLLAQTFFAFLG